MSRCGIIVARQSDIVGERRDGYLAECVEKINHLGPHRIETPEGTAFEWEDDWNCGCCEPHEYDRCYTFWPVLSTTRSEPQK